eukprot:gnl/TRDRNA2_/TRDRNA2_156878_c0_seq4.p1 gnl/TRDRNA2_/TRDRNA2_156878_c0~~gnl/TRDRNA2_/TRDRNA2_156878_c0_seq4.p1  ORF type:complete len:221 (+),score=30.33 gnl/TRDRNA2_/TRDRNA2_156878_c0_seq4:68-730(+)
MSTEKLPRTPGDRRWENQKSSFENILNDLKTPVQVWWELAEPEAPPPEGITDFGWWCFKVMQQEQDEIVLEPGEDTGYFPLLMDLLHLICGRHLTAKPDDKPTCKEYRAPNEAGKEKTIKLSELPLGPAPPPPVLEPPMCPPYPDGSGSGSGMCPPYPELLTLSAASANAVALCISGSCCVLACIALASIGMRKAHLAAKAHEDGSGWPRRSEPEPLMHM